MHCRRQEDLLPIRLDLETLVDLTIEGTDISALADSSSQVNTIMPALVQWYGFLVLPLEDLVNYPLNLVGLGGK